MNQINQNADSAQQAPSQAIVASTKFGKLIKGGLALLLACLASQPAQAQLVQLNVNLQGLEPATGTVEVTIFDSAEDFLKKPFMQKASPVEGSSELTIEFAGMLDGDYAIVVVHDENGNKKLDNGFFGLGGEGIGYSNDAAPWLGRPSFEDARFTIGTEDLDLLITLD